MFCFFLLTYVHTSQERDKKRGRNKISAKLRRKQKNVIDAQTVRYIRIVLTLLTQVCVDQAERCTKTATRGQGKGTKARRSHIQSSTGSEGTETFHDINSYQTSLYNSFFL